MRLTLIYIERASTRHSLYYYCRNAFGNAISDSVIRAQADGLSDRSRTVNGQPTSLADIGYVNLGIDEGWEGCGEGFNGTQHTSYGWPVVDKSKFPAMNSTVSYGALNP